MNMLIQNLSSKIIHVRVETASNLDAPTKKKVDLAVNQSLDFKLRGVVSVLGNFYLTWDQDYTVCFMQCTADNPIFGPNTYSCRPSLQSRMPIKVTREGGGSGSDAWITWIINDN